MFLFHNLIIEIISSYLEVVDSQILSIWQDWGYNPIEKREGEKWLLWFLTEHIKFTLHLLKAFVTPKMNYWWHIFSVVRRNGEYLILRENTIPRYKRLKIPCHKSIQLF